MGHRKNKPITESDFALQQSIAQSKQQTIQLTKEQRWTGPLPSPDDLRKFDQLIPGSAERIIALAEGEALHRRELEKKVLDSEITDRSTVRGYFSRGQLMGFMLAVLFLIATVWIILAGYSISGTIIGSTTLVSLVVIFVLARDPRQTKKNGPS